jgi:hypothetical protein
VESILCVCTSQPQGRFATRHCWGCETVAAPDNICHHGNNDKRSRRSITQRDKSILIMCKNNVRNYDEANVVVYLLPNHIESVKLVLQRTAHDVTKTKKYFCPSSIYHPIGQVLELMLQQIGARTTQKQSSSQLSSGCTHNDEPTLIPLNSFVQKHVKINCGQRSVKWTWMNEAFVKPRYIDVKKLVKIKRGEYTEDWLQQKDITIMSTWLSKHSKDLELVLQRRAQDFT